MTHHFKRLPNHIGIIPDGNRRWAQSKHKAKHEGYAFGVEPGVDLYHRCVELGIKELTIYGFTQDNTKRPKIQTEAFKKACVEAVMAVANKDANLLVIGNTSSQVFPTELLPFTKNRISYGRGLININFLINYGWKWDLEEGIKNSLPQPSHSLTKRLASKAIPRIDLIIRWGGRRRLSGFLPLQSVYADFYIIDDYWPDYSSNHLYEALQWYQSQDITLGG